MISWISKLFRPTRRAAHKASFRPLLEALEDRTVPTTFTVTTTTDAGAGSLRQAMLDANSNPGLDTIVFRIGNSPATLIQPKSIRPATDLPPITDPVIIDGTVPFGTQTVRHVIEIDGSSGVSGTGLRLNSTGSGSTIKGLVINGFALTNKSGIGIRIEGNNNTIQDNRLGTSINGASSKRNDTGILATSSASNNLIGGPLASQGNLVSGNVVGVKLLGSGVSSNTIQGNFIGTNAAGTIPLGNSSQGIFLSNSTNNIVVGNLISGNTFAGILLVGSACTGNVIKANKIGTAADGTSALGNLRFGVLVTGGAHDNTIGGTNAGDGNVVAFNGTANILIGSDVASGSATPAGPGNRVLGNINFRAPKEIVIGDVNAPPLVNDPLDADTGPNNFQNFPVVTSVTNANPGTTLNIALASTPNRSFRVEVFSFSGTVNNQHADLTFRGFVNVTTDSGGNAAGVFTVNAAFPFVALTATDLTTGDTSIDAGFASNVPPMIRDDVLTPDINEGQKATLSGRLVDPNEGDFLTLRVNWGDGTIKDYHPGLEPFAFQHRYTDDGVYNVNFTWFDNHGGSNTRTRQVVVHNVAPELRNLNLSPDNPSVHRRVVLSGRIADPGADTFTLTVAWGDGTVESIERSRDGEFHLKHRYQHAGQFTIHLTVTDDDGGMTDQTLTIDVG